MPGNQIKDITYPSRPKSRFGNVTDDGSKPAAPEGKGDAWFDSSTNILSLPNAAGTAWVDYDLDELGSGAIATVFGRTGAVIGATSDYDASQIDNDSAVAGATVKDALDALDGAGGGGGESPLKMWLSGTSNYPIDSSRADAEWTTNYIVDTNYWSSNDPTKILVSDPTKDLVFEHWWTIYNQGGSGDDNFYVWFVRYDSGGNFQEEEYDYYWTLADETSETNAKLGTHRFPAEDLSAGDYIVMQILSDYGEIGIDDYGSEVKIYEFPEVI